MNSPSDRYSADSTVSRQPLTDLLGDVEAYPGSGAEEVVTLETHISWIFLVGEHAYKVKKPIKTSFLDYSTLAERQRLCHEEVRLDRRFAPELYIGVVPISRDGARVCVEGAGEPVEFAVKMRRFPHDALVGERLKAGQVTKAEVLELASAIANFHRSATPSKQRIFNAPEKVLRNAVDNLTDLQPLVRGAPASLLRSLQIWTRDTFEQLENQFLDRLENGFIRECHGDLHLENIVDWQGRLVPFDGIEFNEEFRYIDVLSDVAFLAMDLAARQRDDLRHLLINAYVEENDDRDSLALLRWYEVYRALIRAKIASMRAAQLESAGEDALEVNADRDAHIQLAHALSDSPTPTLFIMHGVSGSGKSTASELLVERLGAIRLRADVERKRHFGLSPTSRSGAQATLELYSPTATSATYAKLCGSAARILEAGYSVVLDATFLKLQQRRAAQEVAARAGADFNIVDCQADLPTLRQRLLDRQAAGGDASDATPQVLDAQLASREPLTELEKLLVVEFPEATGQPGTNGS